MHTNIYTRCLLYRSLKNALSRSHGSTDPFSGELPHLALDITRAKALTTLTGMADPYRRPGCHECPHWMALRRDTKAIVDDRTACRLMERSTLPSKATIKSLLYPYPALMSVDDPNFLSPLEIKLKHLTTPLRIAVLVLGAARARSRSLYSHATAASPRFADSPCLCTCLQQQRPSRNIHSACGSLDLDLSNLHHAS
jgi:hypothetical protein